MVSVGVFVMVGTGSFLTLHESSWNVFLNVGIPNKERLHLIKGRDLGIVEEVQREESDLYMTSASAPEIGFEHAPRIGELSFYAWDNTVRNSLFARSLISSLLYF